jgi:hypothetical protein
MFQFFPCACTLLWQCFSSFPVPAHCPGNVSVLSLCQHIALAVFQFFPYAGTLPWQCFSSFPMPAHCLGNVFVFSLNTSIHIHNFQLTNAGYYYHPLHKMAHRD